MSNALRIAHGAFGRVALLDMDRSLVRHAHPHCHVLLKVEGADTTFAVGEGIVPLTDRTAVLVSGWEPHAYVHDPEQPKTVILALYIEPEWLKTFRPGWGASGIPGFFEQPCGEVSPRIHRLAHDLAEEMMARPDANATHEALLADLMIAVVERFTPWRTFSIRALDDQRRMDWRIRRVVEGMRANLADDVDTTAMAKGAGLSRAHFFRLFEASTNVPPRIFLNVMRVEAAVAAVTSEDKSFTDIGERLGFAAPSHFTRFFRDHTGVTPSAFRTISRMAL
ncbi:helix-turn-helix domain-containing protein [Xanthobacter oligotrophicus]|uniref:helix-turn-helix domain-containing protein n=1 Tax=Xanthobacter oligotrophicus TaxID=2607286 RepID=UPI0011F22110|nr:AraC family transcriptional regulator [Xanthobacter oligotrophicus]MCG5236738.1 AraC family transcriptional regulator [Xanthobacter oligotrophicus]